MNRSSYLFVKTKTTLAALDSSETHLGQELGSDARRVPHSRELLHSFLEKKIISPQVRLSHSNQKMLYHT